MLSEKSVRMGCPFCTLVRVSARRFDSSSTPETRLCSSKTWASSLPLAVIVVSRERLVSSSVRDSLPLVSSVRKLFTGASAWPTPARHSTRASGPKRWVHSLFRRASDVPVVAAARDDVDRAGDRARAGLGRRRAQDLDPFDLVRRQRVEREAGRNALAVEQDLGVAAAQAAQADRAAPPRPALDRDAGQ